MRKTTSFLLIMLFLAGCAGTPREAADAITVTGVVSVRGAEPFTALLLETEEHNFYVLAFDGDERGALQDQAPGRFRVTGELYRDFWNSQPYAHLRVHSWEPAR